MEPEEPAIQREAGSILSLSKTAMRPSLHMMPASSSSPSSGMQCSICLCDHLHDPAYLDGCSHRFCLECIRKWGSEVTNKCPLCKARFRKICLHGATEAEANKILEVPDRDVEEQDQDGDGATGLGMETEYLNLTCLSCRSEGDEAFLLICDAVSYTHLTLPTKRIV
eukprot:TRINITY_DN19286_c0_g3_i2.p1 TRINITY_DN19286_c0_g3~~TRINITY_DN19286_c0_g3_i2.p1  ORF type:complete len:167 (-),score=20.82 TRINITY_DN19286_c0_g3_i2:22-522(-)